jgi:hypothetical protein
MPKFKTMHRLVSYVYEQNTRDDINHSAHGLADEGFREVSAVKAYEVIQQFTKFSQLSEIEVGRAYKQAKELGLVQVIARKPDNPNFQWNKLMVTQKGENFIEKLGPFKIGKWHFMLEHGKPWSLVIAVLAIIVPVLLTIFLRG